MSHNLAHFEDACTEGTILLSYTPLVQLDAFVRVPTQPRCPCRVDGYAYRGAPSGPNNESQKPPQPVLDSGYKVIGVLTCMTYKSVVYFFGGGGGSSYVDFTVQEIHQCFVFDTSLSCMPYTCEARPFTRAATLVPE